MYYGMGIIITVCLCVCDIYVQYVEEGGALGDRKEGCMKSAPSVGVVN